MARRNQSAINFENYIKKTQGTGMVLNDHIVNKIGKLSKQSSRSVAGIVDQLNKSAELEK